MGVPRIAVSSISSFLGLSCLIAFIILRNYPAAVLGFISGSTDAILVFLHCLEYKRNLLIWYDKSDLRRFCRIGIIVSSIGLLCMGYFATIQIMLKKPIMPIPESGTIPIVWSIVVLRSGSFLMYYAMKYQKINAEDTRTILNTNEEANEETN